MKEKTEKNVKEAFIGEAKAYQRLQEFARKAEEEGLPQIAYLARLIRASMLDVLASDFIRTARAQGLGTAAIVRYHALKPALLPVLSYLGPAVAAILTGSVVIEEVFGIPGLGQFFVRGALNRDYTLVLGISIFYAALVIALNLIVDILYSVIDPRIRHR